jgi:putative pyruvate formate lyase activating enzyme
LNNNSIYEHEELMLLENCKVCPHECGVNRLVGSKGICHTGSGFSIASICIHQGEEPPVSGRKGICNIFFKGCNLRCVYCQNHDISQPALYAGEHESDLPGILDQIEKIMSEGIKLVGFVTPSHVVPQVKIIIKGLHQRGLNPVIVYNTNGYDKAETLRDLSGLIDVYMPDLKYVSSGMAARFSGTSDYPSVAIRALKEMYWQKGSSLRLDDEGNAEYGLLIRHLVLPGYTEESIRVLETIAEELSPGVHISLMSQYHPAFRASRYPEINRPLRNEEYDEVVEAMEKLGFRNGWIQDPESYMNYRPDFSRDHPFEH